MDHQDHGKRTLPMFPFWWPTKIPALFPVADVRLLPQKHLGPIVPTLAVKGFVTQVYNSLLFPPTRRRPPGVAQQRLGLLRLHRGEEQGQRGARQGQGRYGGNQDRESSSICASHESSSVCVSHHGRSLCWRWGMARSPFRSTGVSRWRRVAWVKAVPGDECGTCQAAAERGLKRVRRVGGKGRRCGRRLYSVCWPVECQENLSHKMGSHPLHFTKTSVRGQ